jgi:hypothetical protein
LIADALKNNGIIMMMWFVGSDTANGVVEILETISKKKW